MDICEGRTFPDRLLCYSLVLIAAILGMHLAP